METSGTEHPPKLPIKNSEVKKEGTSEKQKSKAKSLIDIFIRKRPHHSNYLIF
jgi:hypothetical protein